MSHQLDTQQVAYLAWFPGAYADVVASVAQRAACVRGFPGAALVLCGDGFEIRGVPASQLVQGLREVVALSRAEAARFGHALIGELDSAPFLLLWSAAVLRAEQAESVLAGLLEPRGASV